MKLIIIFWPQAVGKMTVWQELTKITDLKLFHNHMTIELVSQFFSYSTEQWKRLVNLFRNEIFEEVAKSDFNWLIFTYLWFFDDQKDRDYIENLCNIFKKNNSEIYFVELEADIQERLIRNKTENRIHHKPTKRNFEKSEKDLKESAENHRLNSNEWEIKEKNYIRINNTKLNPKNVAKIVKQKFNL